jgi:2'-5' RNA ligase
MKLQHDIRENFHFKEKLMPHITIARARNIVMDRENRWNAVLSKIKNDDIEFVVDKFVLFESVPEKGGYIHKVLKVFEADKV